MAAQVKPAPDPDFHVMQARAYVEGLSSVAGTADDHDMGITGFQLMMMLAPIAEWLKQIEREIKQG